jgi:hypothetical protein
MIYKYYKNNFVVFFRLLYIDTHNHHFVPPEFKQKKTVLNLLYNQTITMNKKNEIQISIQDFIFLPLDLV